MKMMMDVFRRGGNFFISLAAIISNVVTVDRFQYSDSYSSSVPRAATFENFTLCPRYIVRVPMILKISFFPHDTTAPCGPGPPHYRDFTITLRHTTLGRTPLDE
jgi:hypothetical protein